MSRLELAADSIAPHCEDFSLKYLHHFEGFFRSRWIAAFLTSLWCAVALHPMQLRAQESQTQPALTSPESEQPLDFVAPSESGVPDEYLSGVAYLSNFREAWNPVVLTDPVLGAIFLALQDGATREDLMKLGLPDLDLALDDLMASRMVRKTGDLYRPAFPLIRGDAATFFNQVIQTAAGSVYPELRPYFKKAQKAAKKEKLAPWLFALCWSEVLESKPAEEMLIDAGALDARRMRDEGYFWIQIPKDPSLVGVERYSSGSETLHYVWTPISSLNPTVQDFGTRRRILDGSLARLPWTDPQTEEALKALGILDSGNKVAVPSLKKNSALLAILRQASQIYVKRALSALRGSQLSEKLSVPRDEAFAVAFSTLGFRIIEKAQQDGWFREPDSLARPFSPTPGLVEALVTTPEEVFRPLEHAYYLYDRGDFDASIRQVQEFLKDHPNDPEALFRLGIANMKLRKYPQALDAFEKGIALTADSSDVWRAWLLLRAGNTLDMMHRREDALTRYEQALTCANVNGSRQIASQWLEVVYQD
ncbi:MAG: tetratricopeptide repeat protein [Acidobacteria bacterium]|nr:tetratricopeptide repeat protein [Acidobacteriota bacterium]